VSVSSWAFHGSADDVHIEGFVIEQYATPGRQGAINPRVGRAGANGVDWVVVGNTVRHGHAWGIKIEHGMVVADNVTDGNGQGGIGGVGDAVLIEHNEITGNCIAGYRCFGWEGGATKFVTSGMVFSANVVTDNLGHGMHPDIQSDDVVIEGNIISDNLGAGIHYETSTNAVISDNTVTGNGFKLDGSREPGILVLNSSSVDITGNSLDRNALGILLRQDDRTDRGIVGDVVVTGNTVVADAASRSGVGSVTIDTAQLGPISFNSNTYSYVDDKPFTFDGTTYTPGEWQGLGYDSGSTFTRR
jgi:parallel beta-helix repeat protein